MLHPSLSHLENIDARFLEPHASLVVMHQDVENSLNDAHRALDGLACIMESAANMNAALRGAGSATQLLEIPPDSFAALIRIVCERIEPAVNNPTLGAVKRLRPDLFNHQGA